MSVVQNNLLMTPEGYQIERSLRFRSSASAYFSRTFASAGNRQKFTISAWVKRGKLASSNPIMGAGATSSTEDRFMFAANDSLLFDGYSPGSTVFSMNTTAVYRDPSAWYHVVVAVDTTQATSSNRILMYVNGVQITAFATATYPTQNANLNINNNVAQYLGYTPDPYYADQYLTEVNFIDGQALTPSSFGETDAVTGVWKPKKYAGTYGTNGFYLNFKDNSAATAAAIGKDYSGNGNNWTPNNISVTAGVTYDSMIDTPTLWADGGNGRGNYCTINPLDTNGSAVSITNGNLTFNNSSTVGVRRGTFGSNSGKIYFEITQDSTVSAVAPINYGIASVEGKSVHNNLVQAASAYTDNSGVNKAFWRLTSSGIAQTVTPSTYSVAVGDIFQVAYDATTGKVWFGQNNVWFDGSGGTTGNPSAGTNAVFTLPDTTQPMAPLFEHAGGNYTATLNCGQRPFAYTPPTGFKALNTQNLPDPTIKKGNQYFDVSLWTGNGTSQTIVNSGGFQPDLVWDKCRNSVYWNELNDSVRGTGYDIYTNTSVAEDYASTRLTSFNSNGFSIGSSTGWNESGRPYVGWQWKAGGAGSSNTNGSITSTVSANTTSGFSIVTYTGTGANATVGHGLGSVPKMFVVKARNSPKSWRAYHTSVGTSAYLLLNSTAASAPDNGWTATSSTTFTVGGSGAQYNANGVTFVAYCFSEVAGFSKFGSYTGNGSADGPFVYLGFRPRFVMVKRTDTAGYSWTILDTARDAYNVETSILYPNLSNAENTGSPRADFLSNGFKPRDSSNDNVSGGTYIFAAFAENPFKNSLAR